MSEPVEESGAQLIARLMSTSRPKMEHLDSNIFPTDGPKPKEIVEISGDVGVGKTTLLMHIMARVILPLDCGGKDGMVLFLLTDHNFDLAKFIAVLEKYICEHEISNERAMDILNASLHNINMQRCFDETQFELAIFDSHRILSESNRYCLLALDSIGAFYYTSKDQKSGDMHYMTVVLTKLQLIINSYKLALVYTKPAYFVQKTTLNRVESVQYFLELVDKTANGTENSNFVYKVDIPKKNQIISRKYGFDVNGCIEWKE